MSIIELFSNDYTLRLVALGAGLLGAVSGIVGSFAVLRRQGLIGDAISHAALPGITLVFIAIQVKSTEFFMAGAVVSGLIAALVILMIDRYTRIKFDSAMALVLSVFFGLGLVLLTYIQKIPNANQAGIEKFIFGQASTLLRRDIDIILVSGGVVLALILIFWKEFKLLAFDPDFGESLGFSSRRLSLLLSAMLVISVIIGLQTVGVILMSSMLIAPGVAARQWTDKLSVMAVLAGIFGAFSGVVGTVISSSLQKMPTGPTIVMVVSLIVVVSILFAPRRGLIGRQVRMLRHQRDIDVDRVLFNLYDLAMNHADHFHGHPIAAIKPIKTRGGKKTERVNKALEALRSKGYVEKSSADTWAMTPVGIAYVSEHPMRKEVSS